MPEDIRQSVQDMWLAVKTATENVFEREITPEELNYLLARYPALEICDINCPFYRTRTPTIIQAPSGWNIFDFDSVLVSSACEMLCLPEEGAYQGKGSVYGQLAATAIKMAELAMEKWQGAEIVSGFYPMQRIFWARAGAKSFRVRGFPATPEDMVVYNWLNAMWNGTFYTPKGAAPRKTGRVGTAGTASETEASD